MQQRTRKRPMSEINVVPYIDVMLVLLVIFMITTPLLTQGVKVALPKAPSEPLTPGGKEPVVISVDAGGRFYINYGEDPDQPVSAQILVNRVSALMRYQANLPVMIRGDSQVPYGRVVAMMAMLQGAGVPNVGLITASPEEQQP